MKTSDLFLAFSFFKIHFFVSKDCTILFFFWSFYPPCNWMCGILHCECQFPSRTISILLSPLFAVIKGSKKAFRRKLDMEQKSYKHQNDWIHESQAQCAKSWSFPCFKSISNIEFRTKCKLCKIVIDSRKLKLQISTFQHHISRCLKTKSTQLTLTRLHQISKAYLSKWFQNYSIAETL